MPLYLMKVSLILIIINKKVIYKGTSAAEALIMAYNQHSGLRKKFFISKDCFIQTIDVVKTKAHFLGIECIVGDELTYDFSKEAS